MVRSMANDTSETFETERTFEADPDTVWQAITEADQLSKWFGAEVDFSPISGSEGTGTRLVITERIVHGTMMMAGAQLAASAR